MVVCVMIEHNYCKIKQYFTINYFARDLNFRQSPISIIYNAPAIMKNFHVCIYKCEQTAIRSDVGLP